MGYLFVSEGLVHPYILAIDSALIKARKGQVWHKSSMEKKGIVPRSAGIDIDARWGLGHTPKDGYLDINCIWYQVMVLL